MPQDEPRPSEGACRAEALPRAPEKQQRGGAAGKDASERDASPFRSFSPPEPSSINAILREHSGLRLYVPPLRWTSQHLELLCCRFQRLGEPQEQREEAQQQEQQQQQQQWEPLTPRDSVTTLRDMLEYLQAEMRIPAIQHFRLRCVEGLLKTCGIYYHNIHYPHSAFRADPRLPLSFARKKVSRLLTDGVYSFPSASAVPSLALLDLDTMNFLRERSVKSPRKQKQLQHVPPIDKLEDPYFAAVIIALAQQQRRKVASHDVLKAHILVLDSCPTAPCLYFYTADISPGFLDRLEQPSRAFPADPPVISYYPIPLKGIPSAERAMSRAASTVHGTSDFVWKGPSVE